MRVTLQGAATDGTDLTVLVDRHADPAGYTQQKSFGVASKIGTFPLAATFYAGSGGGGSVVATAQASVTILEDGSGIGNISAYTRVASVTVVPASAIKGTGSSQLAFTARDANGAVVAVTPGSGFWHQVDGASSLALTQDGVATGIQPGFSSVNVAVDGIQSASSQIRVDNNPDGAATVLRFDDLPSVSSVSGTPIVPAARLSDLYLGLSGIRFSSGAGYVGVIQLRPGEAPSEPHAISGSTPDGLVTYDQAFPTVIEFFDPKQTTVKAGTKRFSCTTDKVGVSDQVVKLTAYDIQGNVVDVATAADNGGVVMTVQSATPNIHRVVMVSTRGNTDGVGLDDVTFLPVVPVD